MKKRKTIKLRTGMHVVIKNDAKNFMFSAGKTKKITKILPDFGTSRAFELDSGDGIWCIVDFEKCVEYPNCDLK